MEEPRKLIFVVEQGEEGVRLDVYCASKIDGLSRNGLQKLNEAGLIQVNSVKRPHHYHVRAGDTVEVELPQERTFQAKALPQDIPVGILYQDEHVVVVEKEAGMVVHPAHGHPDGTLVNALLGKGIALSSLGSPERPGVVHRLDKDTSGLLVFAKTDEAYESLSKDIREKKFSRIYHAITWGRFGLDQLTIDYPIGRHPVERKKMAVLDEGGKQAVSAIFVMDTFEHFEYIRVAIRTGRTHQIRVHLAKVLHPVLGDPVYGGRKIRGGGWSSRERAMLSRLLGLVRRQALHASTLSFAHPISGVKLEFRTALPDDMRQALELLYREDQPKGGKH